MNKRILLIDDEPDLLENTTTLLELNGYVVDTATNGQEGLYKAQQCRPDLIICDIRMPVMDGLELVERIRQTPGLRTTPFIFFSAKVTATDIRHGMNLGADDYLTKPFAAKDLMSSVAGRLARAQAEKEEIQNRIRETKAMINKVSAHEYNTPLNGIIGATYLLNESYTSSDNKEATLLTKEVIKAGWRLKQTLDNSLLTNLLLNATGTSVPAYYTTGSCSITTGLILAIIQKVEQRYDSGRTVDVQVEEASLSISQQALQKCLEEVIDNGFKFSETGGRILIHTGFLGDGYSLTVRNEGRLFLPEDIARIDAYHQFDRKKYEQQGMGVGLFIVQKLVEVNGGQLLIESSVESGTSVTLYFSITKSVV